MWSNTQVTSVFVVALAVAGVAVVASLPHVSEQDKETACFRKELERVQILQELKRLGALDDADFIRALQTGRPKTPCLPPFVPKQRLTATQCKNPLFRIAPLPGYAPCPTPP